MADILYAPRVSPDGLGNIAPVQGSDGSLTAQATARFGQAMGGFGATLGQIASQFREVNAEADVMRRRTNFLLGVTSLNDKYRNDEDPTTVAQRYDADLAKLRDTALDGVDPAHRPKLEYDFQRQSVSAFTDQQVTALKRQGDQYTGQLDAQYQAHTARYAAARTDGERQTAQDELETVLQSGLKSGYITHKSAEAYREGLRKSGDEAQALRMIGANPAGAQAALADPNRFSGLDPVRREQLVAQSRGAAEELQQQRLLQQARMNPEAVPFLSGRVTSPQQADAVFEKIIRQESGGRPGVVSSQGALGLTQIMPGTAREVAARLGMKDIAALDDAALKERLTSDPALNRQLGSTYFKDNLRSFNGNLAPAIASYHAGPGGAVAKAHQAAMAKYGDGYSPAQFLEFLPPTLKDGDGKTTVSYVQDVFKRMGADVSAPAMSPMASYRLSAAMDGVWQQEQARQKQVIDQIVSVGKRQADELAPILKDGYTPDPAAVAQTRATLSLGVSRGDAGAAEKLRSFEEAVSIAPVVQQMYRMKPEQLEGELAQARQQMAQGVVTPDLSRRVQLMEGVSREIATARRDNPHALLERQGIAPVTSVQIPQSLDDSAGMAAFRQQVAMRGVNRDQAQRIYNNGAFFKPEEKTAAAARFAEMNDSDKFRLMEAVAQAAPSEGARTAALGELTGGDKIAQTAGIFIARDPGLAKSILNGAALLQQDGVKAKLDDLKKSVAGVFGGDMYPPEVQQKLLDAALAVYAAERGKNWALYDAADASGMQSAVERVVGKVEKINGRRVPLPAEVTPWKAVDAISRIDAAGLEKIGGAFFGDGTAVPPALFARTAQLLPIGVGDGRYAVVMAGPNGQPRPLHGADKRPLTIDLADFVRDARAARGPTPQQTRNALAAEYLRRGPDGRVIVPGVRP